MSFHGTGSPSAQFAQFCERFVKVPVSNRVEQLTIRPWQQSLVASVWDADPMPRIAAWSISRGNGKSQLAAALSIWTLYTGGESATVDIFAVNEVQARIIGDKCKLIVQRNPALNRRARIYKDRIVVGEHGAAQLQVLAASASAAEGRDALLTVCDEIGRIDRELWEVCLNQAGKREQSVLLGIGTPGPADDNVLSTMRTYGIEHPEDTSQVFREHSAAGFESHPVDCEHCWELGSPALDDFLSRDGIRASLPPKSTESHFRRVRLGQHVFGAAEPAIPGDLWASLSTGKPIPDGGDVVLAFDGSYSGTDATVLVACTVSKRPHLDVLNVFARPSDAGDDWRVDVLAVEQAIRDACKRYRVKEIACDTYRWQRSLEVLDAEGLPVVEFPQTVSRMSAATSEFLQAVTNHQLTHSGDAVLTQHIANAVLSEDGRGGRLVKASRSRHAGRIDCAVAAVMCHSRATFYATRKPKRYRVIGI